MNPESSEWILFISGIIIAVIIGLVSNAAFRQAVSEIFKNVLLDKKDELNARPDMPYRGGTSFNSLLPLFVKLAGSSSDITETLVKWFEESQSQNKMLEDSYRDLQVKYVALLEKEQAREDVETVS